MIGSQLSQPDLEGALQGYMYRKNLTRQNTKKTSKTGINLLEIKAIFSNKSNAVNTEQKIKMFKQNKKHIADFMIELKALAMKAETNDIYTIFLLKKNVGQTLSR